MLNEFMAIPHRFGWGGVDGDDCMTFCASWVQFSTGIDPAIAFRGTYNSEIGAHRLIRAHGGLVKFADGLLRLHGFAPVVSPVDGDVGIVRVPFGDGGNIIEVAAVRYGPLWLMLSEHGLAAKKADCIAVWGLSR